MTSQNWTLPSSRIYSATAPSQDSAQLPTSSIWTHHQPPNPIPILMPDSPIPLDYGGISDGPLMFRPIPQKPSSTSLSVLTHMNMQHLSSTVLQQQQLFVDCCLHVTLAIPSFPSQTTIIHDMDYQGSQEIYAGESPQPPPVMSENQQSSGNRAN